jgi:hypothetical protein
LDDLRPCASSVVGRCGGGRLVFVGRSPESLFDYLSGVFDGTAWEGRLIRSSRQACRPASSTSSPAEAPSGRLPSFSWIGTTGIDAITNVSIAPRLWRDLGNDQVKVTESNPPSSWDDDGILLPPRDSRRLEARRRAADLFRRGAAEKREVAERLARERAMKEAWLRDLVGELRS